MQIFPILPLPSSVYIDAMEKPVFKAQGAIEMVIQVSLALDFV